jgi:hypothetical protein
VAESRPADLAQAVPERLGSHPAIGRVKLVGSRANSAAHDLSDWDFAVETSDFASVARDLPRLVASLTPLAEQWDPYSDFACYMLMLAGPTKVDLIFPAERRAWSAPWDPRPDTLDAIDRHFWDWALWLEQKRRGGQTDTAEKSLRDQYELLLRPLGVSDAPRSVDEAVAAYVEARRVLEARFGLRVPRRLEEEVRPVVARSAAKLR